ncbi:hypothetical protein HII36_12190 [Nonomuraea sp. NN258]|uniref:hypothetical protein n=1 Tax=Nonomuraea antri TaxID=2730852 RepID=UPI00156A1731|nr:hypothetical protein [Nonomuraea antri]NRQ32593.1 hypothetical protein [Nonomuraea antri]
MKAKATVTSVRARDMRACAAGLLRFAAPDEVDALLGDPLARGASVSYGLLNRAVAESLLRRPGARRLPLAAELLHPASSLLGLLLELDDPRVNGELFLSGEMPRNLRRQLAHQTSRRDGVTPLPLPGHVLDQAAGTQRHLNLLLHAADPGTAGPALRRLGRGADPHGAIRACRTLLDAGHTAELAELVELRLLPEARWGPGGSEPSVSAYARAALTGSAGAARLREVSERVRRAGRLRSVAELADADACAPSGEGRLVRSVVHRRHPAIFPVDWAALLDGEPERRRREGPLPYRAARLLAQRVDAPEELLLLAIADHPELAPLAPSPSPALLALVRDHLPVVGAAALVKVAGNGQVAGTITVERIAAVLPPEALDRYAESLWLPGLRGTAALRVLLGRDGDVPLRPFVTDETGFGTRRRLRIPGERAHWDAEAIYGPHVADELRRLGELSADEVLSMVTPDAVLAPRPDAMPDLRVLRRLAELVHVHLGGRPEAWMVALRLLQEGFVGTLPELLATAGAVAA